jgi:hypothetical protein
MNDFVCYCFGFTVADIEQDFLDHGKSLIMEKILGEKTTGGCNCLQQNPKGR